MKIYTEFYESDRRVRPGETMGKAELLEVTTSRGRVQGFILTPNHAEGELHPAVLMLHGFPGIANNHELGQSLRKAGFVVFNPFAPGAWGSDGFYSFDGIVDAAVEIAEFIRSPEVCRQYHIDPEYVYVLGHSMGGFAAVNATRRLPWTRGTVLIAPCDIGWYFEHDDMSFPVRFPEIAERILKTNENLYENARRIHKDYSYTAAAEDLKDRNILFIRCAQDVEIPMDIATPFFSRIESFGPSCAVRRLIIMDTDHAYNDSKNLMAKTVTDWMAEIADMQ